MDLIHQIQTLQKQATSSTVAVRCQAGDAPDNSQFVSPVPSPRIIFPGSFNPLHQAHQKMARIAAWRLKMPTEFEISITNVDKASPAAADVARQIQQFANGTIIWLTQAATFAEKARIFPEATFVVGADTVKRIADVKYYGDDLDNRDDGIRRLVEYNTRFLVFGRSSDDCFETLSKIELPDELRNLCESISEQDFREDVSSTELRDT